MILQKGKTKMKKLFLLLIGLCSCLLSVPLMGRPVHAANSCSKGKTLSIVAHPDDDLLFLSPDLLRDVQSGRCVQTLFVTSGDAGKGLSRALQREQGVREAYAAMAGFEKATPWDHFEVALANHKGQLYILRAHPEVRLFFLRLPDGGNEPGSSIQGFTANHHETLRKLWEERLPVIHPIDRSTAYTKQDLVKVLQAYLRIFQPDIVRGQDFTGTFIKNDHSDHHAVGLFAVEAHRSYRSRFQRQLIAYQGYEVVGMPVNVEGSDLRSKQEAFFAYNVHDGEHCTTEHTCRDTHFLNWLSRQYVTAIETTGSRIFTAW